MPRWVLLAWLWLNLPGHAISVYVCKWDPQHRYCDTVQEILDVFFALFPVSIGASFVGLDERIYWAALVAATGACHLVARRFLPERLSLLSYVGVVLGWYAVSFTTFWISFGIAIGADLPEILAWMF